MEIPGQNPLHEHPEPEHAPGPQEENNHLDKSSLDIESEESLADALLDRRAVAMLVHIAGERSEEPIMDSSPLQVFGVLVGSLRRKQGKTLEEVAERAGWSTGDLFALELGELSLDQVLAGLPGLGKALGGKGRHLARALAELILSAS